MLDFSATHLIALLDKKHVRAEFDCGVPVLNDYLIHQSGQDLRRKVTTIWVATRKETNTLSGFYTLSMASIPLERLSEDIQKKLPRYGNVPAVRLGRLAIAKEEQGQGLGKYLLTDAMFRCLKNEIAWALFLVDAKNETARKFYEEVGFLSLKWNVNNLYMPRSIIERERKLDE